MPPPPSPHVEQGGMEGAWRGDRLAGQKLPNTEKMLGEGPPSTLQPGPQQPDAPYGSQTAR